MNDITLRSQALGKQGQQFYDAQRYESMRGTGQSLQQLGHQIPEVLQAQQMIDQRSVALAHEHATQQAELQLGYEKLRASQALDGSELSFQAVRQARLANDAQEFALQEQRRRSENANRNELAEMNASLARALGASGQVKYGFDPTKAGTHEAFYERSDDEIKKLADTEQQMRHSGSNGTTFNQQRNYFMQMHKLAYDAGDTEGADYWASRMQAIDPEGGAPTRPQASQPKKPSREEKARIDPIKGRITGSFTDDQKTDLAQRAYAAMQHAQNMLKQSGGEPVSDEIVMNEILNTLNDMSEANAPKRQALLALLAEAQ